MTPIIIALIATAMYEASSVATIRAGRRPGIGAAGMASKALRNASKVTTSKNDARAEAMRRHPAGKGRTS